MPPKAKPKAWRPYDFQIRECRGCGRKRWICCSNSGFPARCFSCCPYKEKHHQIKHMAQELPARFREILGPFAALHRSGWKGTVFEGKADHEPILILNEGKPNEVKVTVGDFALALKLVREIDKDAEGTEG